MPGMIPRKKSPNEIEEEFERLRAQHNESLANWMKTHSRDDEDNGELKSASQAAVELQL
jgi:hypothetical protein